MLEVSQINRKLEHWGYSWRVLHRKLQSTLRRYWRLLLRLLVKTRLLLRLLVKTSNILLHLRSREWKWNGILTGVPDQNVCNRVWWTFCKDASCQYPSNILPIVVKLHRWTWTLRIRAAGWEGNTTKLPTWSILVSCGIWHGITRIVSCHMQYHPSIHD